MYAIECVSINCCDDFNRSTIKSAEHQINKITSDVLFPLSNSSPLRGDKQYADMHHHEWYGELAQANQQIDALLKKKQLE